MKLTALTTIEHDEETHERGDVFEVDDKDNAQRLIDTGAALKGEQKLEDDDEQSDS